MVSCPVCNRDIELDQMNSHLDSNCAKRPVGNLSSILTGNRKRKLPTQVIDLDEETPRSQSSPPPYTPVQRESSQKDHEVQYLRNQLKFPLPERLRPTNLDQYIGQQHLVGPQGLLRGFIERDQIPSMILWGPPGVGKTTLCRIISHMTQNRFVEMSATSTGLNECRKLFEELKNELKLTKRRTVLFCDEIHRFNKSQQDVFLPHVEKGDIILIGATTENPSFQLNGALLSRCRVFTLNKLTDDEMSKVLNRAVLSINKIRKLVLQKPVLQFHKDAINYILNISDGDSRIGLNLLEIIDTHYHEQQQPIIEISAEDIKPILQRSHMLYDRKGDNHYDTISLFHKSVRGSDADAALYYLLRMLKGGEDPLYIARRMIRIASEDVGCMDDSCLPFAVLAYKLVQMVGLPELDLLLVHCAYKLSLLPKSVKLNKLWSTWQLKLQDDSQVASAPIPLHLRNAPTKLMENLQYGKDYKYNPNYLNGKVNQTYLPDLLQGVCVLSQCSHLGELIDPDL